MGNMRKVDVVATQNINGKGARGEEILATSVGYLEGLLDFVGSVVYPSFICVICLWNKLKKLMALQEYVGGRDARAKPQVFGMCMICCCP